MSKLLSTCELYSIFYLMSCIFLLAMMYSYFLLYDLIKVGWIGSAIYLIPAIRKLSQMFQSACPSQYHSYSEFSHLFPIAVTFTNMIAYVVLWPTASYAAGQERFRTLTSSYYRGAQGIIMGIICNPWSENLYFHVNCLWSFYCCFFFFCSFWHTPIHLIKVMSYHWGKSWMYLSEVRFWTQPSVNFAFKFYATNWWLVCTCAFWSLNW